jgi:hypothetical protein
VQGHVSLPTAQLPPLLLGASSSLAAHAAIQHPLASAAIAANEDKRMR